MFGRSVSVGLSIWMGICVAACGSSGSDSAPSVPVVEDECDSAWVDYKCTPTVSGCANAYATCLQGEPQKLGPCACETAQSVLLAAPDGFRRMVAGGAFGGDRFYWTDSGYMGSDPYSSRIFSGPIGSAGAVLVPKITSTVSWLRVTDTTLYAMSTDGPLAFSLTGQPLPNPTREEAFPEPTASGRAALSEGFALSIDGVVVQEGVGDFAETAEGVYYAGFDAVLYRAFADLEDVKAVAAVEELSRIWVSGTALYLASGEGTGFAALHYADLSVVGKP